MLTPEQITKAKTYYDNHKYFVDNLIQSARTSFPPTMAADKNDPRIWKESHWKWFFETFNFTRTETQPSQNRWQKILNFFKSI
jgi:hypothetical protein